MHPHLGDGPPKQLILDHLHILTLFDMVTKYGIKRTEGFRGSAPSMQPILVLEFLGRCQRYTLSQVLV